MEAAAQAAGSLAPAGRRVRTSPAVFFARRSLISSVDFNPHGSDSRGLKSTLQLSLAALHFGGFPIVPWSSHQLRMRPALDDPAVIQHQHQIRLA